VKRMALCVIWTLFWLAGPHWAPAFAAESTPGHHGARFSVKQGVANYRVPIRTPPGIDNLQPNLSLTYASGGGLQLSGVGWRLSGLSGIARKGAVIAVDGYSGGVAYDREDRFAYGGQELIAVEGVYGAPGTRYQTQITNRSSIVSQGACGSGPCSFTVKTATGMTMTFGVADNSRIYALGGDSVRVWALDSVTDLNGNSMAVTYSQDPLGAGKDSGQAYPIEIAYTANAAAGMAANRFIRFDYAPRAYPIVAYEGGYPIHSDAVLTHVKTYLGDNLVLDYQLDYKPSPATGRDLLATLRVCGPDACIDPISFDYSEETLAFDSAKTWCAGDFTAGQGWTLDKQPVTLADVNGDGRADIVGFRKGTQVALSNGQQFTASQTWIQNFSTDQGWSDQDDDPRFVADLNGDGKADILGFNQQGTVTALSNGKGFQLRPTFSAFGGNQGWGTQSDNPRMIADVNGDHIMDIVGFKGDTQVALGTENGFQPPTSWSSDFGAQQGWQNKIRTLADVNGDGLADVVGFGSDSVVVALSTGSAFASEGWSAAPYQHFTDGQGWNTGQNQRMMADLNGDGLMDILGFSGGTQSASGTVAALSTGSSFVDPASWSDNFGNPDWTNSWNYRTVADVNGDGLADAVGFGNQQVQVGLSNTSSFAGGAWQDLDDFCQNQGWQVGANARFAVDVNGDGLADIVGFGSENVSVSLASGSMPDLLTQVVNGIGGAYRVDYAPLSDSDVYAETKSAAAAGFLHSGVTRFYDQDLPIYPNAALAGASSYVVSGYTAQNDAAVNQAAYSYRYSYQYANAQINLEGRGWQGFQTVTALNHQTGRQTVTSYNQDFPLTGMMAQQQRQCGPSSPDPNCSPGAIQSIVRYDYLTKTAASGSTAPNPPIYFVNRQAQTRDFYEYGAYSMSVGTTYAYDADGNRNVVAKLNRVDQQGNDLDPGDNVYELLSYQNDEAKNLYGFPNYWKTSKSDSLNGIETFNSQTDLQLTRYGYDARMNRTSKARWDNEPNVNNWIETTFAYDAFGNQTQITDPAGVTTTIAVETTYRTYPETSRTPPGGAGQPLVTRYAFDARFGLPAGTVNPSGDAFTRCYDDFGRPIVQQGPLPDDKTKGESLCMDANNVTNSGVFSGKQYVTLASVQYAKDSGSVYIETQSLQSWPTATASGATRWQKTYLDGLARAVRSATQSDCGSGDADILMDRAYNDAGRPTSVSLPYYDGDPAFNQTFSYDSYGRLIQTSKPAGNDGAQASLTTLSYAGSAAGGSVTVTQAAGQPEAYARQIVYGFANNRRLATSMIVPGDGAATTQYGYDLLGRPTSATSPATSGSPNGLTNRVHYDSLGRKSKLEDATRGTILYGYDAGDQLVSRMDANGKTVFGYDALGRMISIARPDKTQIAFSYDQNGDLGHLTGVALTNGAGHSANHAYEYDPYGRRRSAALSLPGYGDYLSGYGYDPAGRLIAYAAPNGQRVEWGYNACRLDRVTLDGQVFAAFQYFTAAGQPGRIAYGNGVQTQLAYAPAGQPIGQAVINAQNELLSAQTLAWNLLGQIVSLAELTPSDPQALGSKPPPTNLDANQPGVDTFSFQYDNLRLVGASSSNPAYPTQSFAYDPAGNLTDKNGISYQLKGFQAVSGSGAQGAFQASYDAMGAMTALSAAPTQGDKVDWAYEYDAINKLIKASKNGQAMQTNVYDYLGRRLVRQDAQGEVTIYVDKLYQEKRDGDDVTQTLRLDTPYGLVATVDSKASGPAASGTVVDTRYFSQNHLRSTVMTTDAAGNVTSQLHYLPYGELWGSSGDEGFEVKFTGKELDAETGLYDYGARFYSPALGRFLSADNRLGASRFRQDAYNRYQYALGDPMLYRDPTGHWAESTWRCVGFGMVGGTAIAGSLTYAITKSVKGEDVGLAWGEATIGVVGGVGAIMGGCSGALDGASWGDIGTWLWNAPGNAWHWLRARFHNGHEAPGDGDLGAGDGDHGAHGGDDAPGGDDGPPGGDAGAPGGDDGVHSDDDETLSSDDDDSSSDDEATRSASQGEDDSVSGKSMHSGDAGVADDAGDTIAEDSGSFFDELLGMLARLAEKIFKRTAEDVAGDVVMDAAVILAF